MYRAMGETHPVVAPSLSVGDVLVFTKCTVHTCSGDTGLSLVNTVNTLISFFDNLNTLFSLVNFAQAVTSSGGPDTPGRSDSSLSRR